MSRPGEKIQIWWCMDWRCKCWHVGAILGEHHSWVEIPTDDIIKTPDFERDDRWSLYHWGGLSNKWVLCRPDNMKVGMNDNLSVEQIPEAILWATQAIEVLGGRYIEE